MDAGESIVNVSGACFDYVRVFSDGIWNVKPNESILQHSLVRLHAQLALIVIITNCFHFVLKRFHLPRISSEILAGIVLGPTGLGGSFVNLSNALFPPLPNQVLASLSKLGYILFCFLAGVRMDPRLVKISGRRAIILGFFLFAFPFTMVQTTEIKFIKNINLNEGMKAVRIQFSMIYFSAITTCQFVGVASILMQLKITNSRLGHLALASTLVSELLRFGYSTVLGFLNAMVNISARVGILSMLLSLAFIVLILNFLREMVFWFIRKTREGETVGEIYTTITIAVVLILSSMGDNVGLYYLFGPFLFGLVLPAGSPLASVLIEKLETVVSGLLIPLLITFCATKFDLWDFFDNFHHALYFQITLIGFGIKLIATFIMAICCKISLREAAAFTIIVNAKGVLEIGILLSFGNLETKDVQATSGIFLVFLLSAFQPPIVKILYDPEKQYIGYRKKSIQQSSNNEELPVLVCAHKQEDATATIKVLELSNPTKLSPLSIYGMCMEELVSRTTPLLIDHQLRQKTSPIEGSRSQPIIDIFNYFESQHKKVAQVHVFTAISPLKQMHEDICWLAFDKGTSLIILPFHRRLNSRGKMVSGNTELRNLNINVLNRAPCSVAILVDRRGTRGLSSIFISSTICHVSALFVGGADDREALAYSLRMGGSQRVQLTVIHFRTNHDQVQDRWETMLDDESLRSVRHEASRSGNISYREETVRDGSDTAAVVQSIIVSHDLILVGRRHETEPGALSGLSEWTELPELGPIGDLLASSDITSPVSVMVVQQQIMKASHSSTLN